MKGGNSYFYLCLFSLRSIWTFFIVELCGQLKNKPEIFF